AAGARAPVAPDQRSEARRLELVGARGSDGVAPPDPRDLRAGDGERRRPPARASQRPGGEEALLRPPRLPEDRVRRPLRLLAGPRGRRGRSAEAPQGPGVREGVPRRPEADLLSPLER